MSKIMFKAMSKASMPRQLNRHLFTLLTVFTSVIISGCNSTPSQVIVAPQINQSANTLYQGIPASFTVKDLRSSNHIIQILQADKAAKLLSPNRVFSDAVAETLRPYLNAQGLNLSGGNIQIEVEIERAMVSVQQTMMKYDANSDIQVRVKVSKGDSVFTNVFNARGNSNGPLSADVAVLERDFNQLLGKLIADIANHPDMINFIRS